MCNPIINIKNLSKSFIKKEINNGYDLPFLSSLNKFFAIKDVTQTIYEGEYVALLGRNGSGKSTLLKCLSGIYSPSSGEININGTFSPVIEVSSAFHEMLTGKENLYTFGLILGFSQSEIENKINAIINFSGLSNFIDTPFRHYSSGMKIRLVFSIISHLLNDILFLDEVFAVGDSEFKEKSKKKIYELRERKKTIIHVTHSFNEVRDICTKLIVLDKGKVIKSLDNKKDIDDYGNISLT